MLEEVDCGRCLAGLRKKGGDVLIASQFYDGQVGVTRTLGGAIYAVPYNEDFQAALKNEIPKGAREWRKDPKGWFIVREFCPRAEEVIRNFFDPRSWRKAFHLLGITTSAPAAVIYVAYLSRQRESKDEPAALKELEGSVEALSIYYESNVLELGRKDLLAMGFRLPE